MTQRVPACASLAVLASIAGASIASPLFVDRLSTDPVETVLDEGPADPVEEDFLLGTDGYRVSDFELVYERVSGCLALDLDGSCATAGSGLLRRSESVVQLSYRSVGAFRETDARRYPNDASTDLDERVILQPAPEGFRAIDIEYIWEEDTAAQQSQTGRVVLTAVPDGNPDVVWSVVFNRTADEVRALRNTNLRPIDVEYTGEDPSGEPTFAVLWYRNLPSDPFHEPNWSFADGLGAGSVALRLGAGDRPLDMEPRPGRSIFQPRYDVIFVPGERGGGQAHALLSTLIRGPVEGVLIDVPFAIGRSEYRWPGLADAAPLTAGYRLTDIEFFRTAQGGYAADALIIDAPTVSQRAVRNAFEPLVTEPVIETNTTAGVVVDASSGRDPAGIHPTNPMEAPAVVGQFATTQFVNPHHLFYAAYLITRDTPDRVAPTTNCPPGVCPPEEFVCQSGSSTLVGKARRLIEQADGGAAADIWETEAGALQLNAFAFDVTGRGPDGPPAPLGSGILDGGPCGSTLILADVAALARAVAEGSLTTDPTRQALLEDVLFEPASPSLRQAFLVLLEDAGDLDPADIAEIDSTLRMRSRVMIQESVSDEDGSTPVRDALHALFIEVANECENDEADLNQYGVAAYVQTTEDPIGGAVLDGPILAGLLDVADQIATGFQNGCDIRCELDLAAPRGLGPEDRQAALAAIDAADPALDLDLDGEIAFDDFIEFLRLSDGFIGFGCTEENGG